MEDETKTSETVEETVADSSETEETSVPQEPTSNEEEAKEEIEL